MLKDLQKFYRKNGILSTHFTCRWKKECKSGNRKFTGPKSSFVPSGYEKGRLPRLLFLSLDSGSAEKDPNKRTPAAVRRQEETKAPSVESFPTNRHWYRTHELARYILRQFRPKLDIEDAKKYFAHVNSAKCCLNNPGRKEASKRLFDNCRPYLLDEFKILKPKIVVSQGYQAKRAIETMIDRVVRRRDEFSQVVSLNEREAFWLHTHHPASYGPFNKQRAKGAAWERYSKRIYEWGKGI